MIQVDTKQLQQKLKKAQLETKKQIKGVFTESLMKTGQSISKYAPPFKYTDGKSKGEPIKVIPAQMYKRPIFSILSILKSDKRKLRGWNRKQLRQRFEQGYRYVARKDGLIKPVKIFWGKNKREMQTKYKRIKYRGLVKIMFGLQLLLQGVKNRFFARMLEKSKDLRNLSNYNKVKYSQGDNTYSMENKNQAIPSESLVQISKQRAQRELWQRLKYYCRKMMKQSYK